MSTPRAEDVLPGPLAMRRPGDGLVAENARLRALLAEVVKLDDDGYLLGCSPLLARIRREAGLE